MPKCHIPIPTTLPLGSTLVSEWRLPETPILKHTKKQYHKTDKNENNAELLKDLVNLLVDGRLLTTKPNPTAANETTWSDHSHLHFQITAAHWTARMHAHKDEFPEQ